MGKRREVAHDDFERFYGATIRELSAFVARRVHRDSVCDTIADIYTVVWRRWSSMPCPPEDRYWLYGVARRTCWRRAERDQRDLRRHEPGETFSELRSSTDHAATSSELGTLRAAMDQLSPLDRELLLLACVEDRPRGEIAVMMEIAVSTLNVRICRARARLRDLLDVETLTESSNAEPVVFQ